MTRNFNYELVMPKTMDNIPTMLTISETARQANMSEYCVRRLVKQGKIKHIKTGIKVLINWERFVHFLNEGVDM
ncbi:MAG: helix-turn-helix domain-containing protein [Defluviitaleaceae bacterium]|nr:helix-turn-helix domain-containing protein [Defluviitaleaceae bacterium]